MPWAASYILFYVLLTSYLCHGHCLYCHMLCAVGTAASCIVSCILMHAFCHFVPWALLLHSLYAVYCCILCAMGNACLAMGTAASFIAYRCFITCMYAVYCRIICAAGAATLCHGHCCFIYCMYVCCVLPHLLCCGHCHFVPKALLLHIRIVCCVLLHAFCHKHCCFKHCMLCMLNMYTSYGHSYNTMHAQYPYHSNPYTKTTLEDN